jgi:hypothetical protein
VARFTRSAAGPPTRAGDVAEVREQAAARHRVSGHHQVRLDAIMRDRPPRRIAAPRTPIVLTSRLGRSGWAGSSSTGMIRSAVVAAYSPWPISGSRRPRA